MKKFLAVIVAALLVSAAVWVILRVQLANQLAAVPEFLPPTTLLLLHAPDFKHTQKRWHESDLYQIWHEPAVQAWLEQPLSRLPQSGRGGKIVEEFLQLGPKHGFVALTSLEKNEPKVLAGFHFEGGPEGAKDFMARREAEWLPKSTAAKRETIVYEQHKIETVNVPHLFLASVYSNHWFFISNDIAALKALLDRADHRQEKAEKSLQVDASFRSATKHLPAEYAAMIFVDPRPFVEKLAPLIALTGQSLPINQLQRLQRVQSLAAAIGFDHGKMRETDFVAMPRAGAEKKLVRPLLAAAGADTFFYSASQLHWSENVLSPSAPAAAGLPAFVQQFSAALNARGISPVDLRQAFGEELEITGDWGAGAPWPALLATIAVTDATRARKIADALTSVEIAGAPWTKSERNGATFYSAEPFGGFVSLHPAIVISDKMAFIGSDAATVEGAMTRVAQPGGELEKSEPFRDAVARVPAPGSAFNYVDARLLFERADAAIRPIALMGATFYPALGKSIDLKKFPPPETIAKHLSPIVMSQRYEGDGYVTESVGPVTFREATIGLAGAIGGLFIYLQEGLKAGGLVPAAAPPSPVPVMPSPAPTATPF